MSGQASAASKPGFPLRRLVRDAVVVLVLCVACALIITAITGKAQDLYGNLVFSLIIGGIAFLMIDVPRLAIWGEMARPPRLRAPNRPRWRRSSS